MKATQLLEKEHEAIGSLFDDFEVGGASLQEKRHLFDAIRRDVEIHMQLEEELLYPVIEQTRTEGEELVDQALKDHDEIKDLLAQTAALDPDDADFDHKMALARETFDQHVAMEATDLFDEAQKFLTEDTLEDIGLEMEELRESLLEEAEEAARERREEEAPEELEPEPGADARISKF
ncbi:MAG: hemerythrin domain-containing protein [Deltaproteobacteria bacterium]|nr:hemerythrin domain-containing protein [Deltaproteobacteria bacterium]